MSEDLEDAIKQLKELSLESRSVAVKYIKEAYILERSGKSNNKTGEQVNKNNKLTYSLSGTIFSDSDRKHLLVGDRVKINTPGKKEGIYFYKGDTGTFVGGEDNWALVYPDKFIGKFQSITIKRLPHNLTKLD